MDIDPIIIAPIKNNIPSTTESAIFSCIPGINIIGIAKIARGINPKKIKADTNQ